MKKILFTLIIISFLFTFRTVSSEVVYSSSSASSSAYSSATTHKVPEPMPLVLIVSGMLFIRRFIK